MRAIPPALVEDTYIYYFDGACRRGDDRRSALFGVLLFRCGIVIARVPVLLYGMSNNEAECYGYLAFLPHLLAMQFTKILVDVDSKLVICQMNGVCWSKAENLTPYYERGLAMMRRLHGLCDADTFVVSRVYREFNADTDSLANAALDIFTRASTVGLLAGWLRFLLRNACQSALAAVHVFVFLLTAVSTLL